MSVFLSNLVLIFQKYLLSVVPEVIFNLIRLLADLLQQY